MNEISREALLEMAQEAGIAVHPLKQQARIGIDTITGDDSTAKLERFAEMVLASQQQTEMSNVVIPTGYALVPTKPTMGMVAALWFNDADPVIGFCDMYRAMLSNAPQPPAVSADDIAAAEREACARVAEGSVNATSGSKTHIAAAIRARGNK